VTSGAAALTNTALKKARNQFWVWVLPVFIVGEGIAYIPGQAAARVIVTGVLIWRTWVLCRTLHIRWWWTALYCVCCLGALEVVGWIVLLVPAIGITTAFQRARHHAERVERGLA
jgi:hypothetical protein